ncbi:unnamed protein product (macronuclear) [Paramecium tetraurelia]|uniref:Uncharacterized protein n=1 Tax=Paramecium tetraurelia TaxID=5888 RepID=A0DBW1_PARTE|nr:uncharacterized protein GSPATT00015405001 [Paramecium tetraurelia]CAK80528.1 unnamed protein product [Paramecium tetraurelia]|eukprot:XP_001447925.1 hypothetical protein (macronuclear) [Paramecium tetraurelia strain d4-2]
MSFIGPRMNCQLHQKYPISLLNLTKGLSKEKRLLCTRCNLQLQQNLYSIEEIFEFAVSISKSEKEQMEILKKDKDQLAQIKNLLGYIQAYYNKLEFEHQQLFDQVLKNLFIKQNDSIDTCIQKKQQSDRNELIGLAEQASLIIKQNSDKIELQENNSIQQLAKLDELRGRIKLLQDQLKMVNNDQSQSIILNQKALYPKLDPVQVIQQKKIVEGSEFIRIAEIQLEQQKIYDIKFNRDNNLFIIGGSKLKNSNCYVQIWKYENDQVSKMQDLENCHSGDVKSICFSSQEDSFFTGSQDTTIIYWKMEPQGWNKSQVLQDQSSGIIGLQLSNKGNVLAAVSNSIYLWKRELKQWEKVQVLNHSKKQYLCVCFNNDDSYLAAGSSDCQIYVYQYQNGQWILKTTIQDQSQEINFITFLQDLNLVAVLKDNFINYYEYSPNNWYDSKKLSTLSSFQVSYSKQSNFLTVASGKQKETLIYQVDQRDGLKKVQQIQAKSDQVYSSNDGKLIALFANQKLEFYSDQNMLY